MIESNKPLVYVWLLGKFHTELLKEDGTQESVPTTAWASGYARQLFKRLLPVTGRRATRSALIDDLWPYNSRDDLGEEDREKRVEGYLTESASRLRRILHKEIIKPIAGGYELARPDLLWTDIHTCKLLMAEVEKGSLSKAHAVTSLETTRTHFERGSMLEGENGEWCLPFRAQQEKAMRRCYLMLAEKYEEQNMLWLAQEQYERLFEINPIAEDALRHLLAMLHRHAMLDDLSSSYEQAQKRFQAYGMPLSETTKELYEHLIKKPISLSFYTSPPKERSRPSESEILPKSQTALGQASQTKKESNTSLVSANPLPAPQKKSEHSLEMALWSIITHYPEFQDFTQQFHEARQRSNTPSGVESASYLVDTSPQKDDVRPSSEIQSQDIIGLEGGSMNEGRRNLTIALIGGPIGLSGMGQQDLITEIQRVLHYPSSGPGDKELKYLEQKIRYYWLDRQNVTIAPADLILHMKAYEREVITLLDRSLLPSMRTRLCACLSEGMLLIGASFYSMGQFQTARVYYQVAIEAAHEAKDNILEALVWKNESFSWIYSNDVNREKYAQKSMLNACHFASLESDLAVQSNTDACLAEVYALSKEKEACIKALERAAKPTGYGHGDRHYIHRFDDSRLNGFRGLCLQQFYRADDPETHPLLEESRQALEELLSQPNDGARNHAFLLVDMAQLHARQGEVEVACGCVRPILDIVGTDAQLQKRLLTARSLLTPYEDVQAVKDLDTEMRALQGQQ